ncbi:MAG: Grx4 family monothiol glutaredoxin [Pseudomonadales bacterium]|nr:Grx4 family monothiol glutaredoxin [Pseudomonadales bacterium]
MSTVDKIKNQIATNPVLLYMKGTADNPQCGFSQAAVEALKKANVEFAYVNVLEAPFIRERLPQVSNWPTFPQLFINGELVGGSDVVCAMVDDGSLQKMFETA